MFGSVYFVYLCVRSFLALGRPRDAVRCVCVVFVRVCWCVFDDCLEVCWLRVCVSVRVIASGPGRPWDAA